MTDRHSGYLVVLTKDTREDDAQRIIEALSMVRGVQSVEPVTANGGAAFIAECRSRDRFRQQLLDLLSTL